MTASFSKASMLALANSARNGDRKAIGDALEALVYGNGYTEIAGTPVSNLTPDRKGQWCLDTTNGTWWRSTGLANTEWTALGDPDISLAELTFLDGATAGTIVASKAVIADSDLSLGTVIMDQIDGGDNALAITGQAQATTVDGGTVTVAGAASIAGATGAGGAAALVGGASGSTNDAGGAASVTGGVGTGTGAGGALTLAAGAAVATGVGGVASIAGGASSGTSGAAGNATVDGGANTATNGAGGAVIVTGGVGNGSGVGGQVHLRSATDTPVLIKKAVAGTGTDTEVLTVAELFNGLFVQTPTAATTTTTPTGAQISSALGTSLAVGDSFDFTIINLGATTDVITFTAGASGVTITGYADVDPVADIATLGSPFGTFKFVNTAADTWIAYRIG